MYYIMNESGFRPIGIRVDVFDPLLYLTTWEIEKPKDDWTPEARAAFAAAVGSICTSPCRAGISNIDGQTT